MPSLLIDIDAQFRNWHLEKDSHTPIVQIAYPVLKLITGYLALFIF